MFPSELFRVALEKEFELSYFSSLGSVESWQRIAVGERDWHYHRLADQKAKEKKQNDEQEAEIKAKSRRSR